MSGCGSDGGGAGGWRREAVPGQVAREPPCRTLQRKMGARSCLSGGPGVQVLSRVGGW